ncbi:MAG: choice-of-anchor tandem repeat GloVer-containing protein [Bacteroidia bacterium]
MKKLSLILLSIVVITSCKKSDTPTSTSTPSTPVTPSGGTFTNLFNFTSTTGQNPYGSLILSGTILYGMTSAGGTNGLGNIFSIQTNGTGYTDLHDFAGGTADGSGPSSDLIIIGSTLYGMTPQGGANGAGVIFSISTSGGAISILHAFGSTANDGVHPQGGLTVSGNTLYATTPTGGANGLGNIFSFNLTGNVYTDLYDFNSGTTGMEPYCTLALANGVLYGTAYLGGGSANDGTVFSYTISSKIFTKLVTFTGTNGANPDGSVILSGTTLYGMTNAGGANSLGNVYAVSTTGTGFTDSFDFTGINGSTPYGTFIINGSTLYGMTTDGGTAAGGDVFSISTGGTGFTNLVNFSTTASPGAFPHGSLVLSNNVLYGMTNAGGLNSFGTIFKYSL